MDPKHRVVVVGGGFQPLIYRVATGMVAPRPDGAGPAPRGPAGHDMRVELAEVTGFDLDYRVVHTTVAGMRAAEIPYDSLIEAGGEGGE